MKYAFLLSVLILMACASKSADPIEAKLTPLREQNQPILREELKVAGFSYGDPVFIRIFKLENTLELWMKDQSTKTYRMFQSYPICSYSGRLGPKLKEGDKQAPEGFYNITPERMHPASQYHLAFNLGFPNTYDQSLHRTGSFLMIHGGCESIGCYAMTDPVMEKIYLLAEAALKKGQEDIPVHIFPFRLSDENIYATRHHKWNPFWTNLKEGYDLFEQTRLPPTVYQGQGYYALYDPSVLSPREARRPIQQVQR